MNAPLIRSQRAIIAVADEGSWSGRAVASHGQPALLGRFILDMLAATDEAAVRRRLIEDVPGNHGWWRISPGGVPYRDVEPMPRSEFEDVYARLLAQDWEMAAEYSNQALFVYDDGPSPSVVNEELNLSLAYPWVYLLGEYQDKLAVLQMQIIRGCTPVRKRTRWVEHGVYDPHAMDAAEIARLVRWEPFMLDEEPQGGYSKGERA